MEPHYEPIQRPAFSADIILWAVRWYLRKYGISYRELQEMLAERGVNVDHSTIYRWFSVMRLKWKNGCAGTAGVTFRSCPWHMDETYVKVNGRWAYLPGRRQPGPHCRFYLPPVVTGKAAYRFLQNPQQREEVADPTIHQHGIKAPAYGRGLLCSNAKAGASDVEHRQIKYRNNAIECDHGNRNG